MRACSLIYYFISFMGSNLYPYFLSKRTINITVIKAERNSATIIETHIPSTPMISGRMNTAAIWNTSVRQIAIIAEMIPLFKAVKNDDPNIEKPVNK